MKDAPRRRSLAALALLLAPAPCAREAPAQVRPAAPQGRPAAQSRSAAQARAADAAERQKRKAVALLVEVADGAKEIEGSFQRATVLTLCADALWGVDERDARAAYRRAWEAAVESDEAEFKEEQEGGRYGDLPERFTRAREGVLANAARRDPRMAEAWVGALAEWVSARGGRGHEEEAAASGPDIGPLNEFTRDGQRLALASTLLAEGSPADAARVAAPAVKEGRGGGALVEFLVNLRQSAPAEADRLYLQLLASARARKDATANDVLLLSSYVLAPRLLAAVGPDGSVRLRAIDDDPTQESHRPAREASAQARSVFFDTAAAVLLLRPPQDSAPGHEAHTVYFAIVRLLPFFERESPRHLDGLQTRLSEIASRLGLERRGALDAQAERLRRPRERTDDPLGKELEMVAGAGDPQLRDAARLRAVEQAAKRSLWERARRLTEEIEDGEQRRAARALTDAFKVANVREAFDGEPEGFEKAAALARAAEVTPALRAYGVGQAAYMAKTSGQGERAALLLQEAFDHAAQTEAGSHARGAVLMMLATVAARLESPRAAEALAAAVAALNEDEEFTGDTIYFNLEKGGNGYGPGGTDALNLALQEFDVRELFSAATYADFGRAVAAARALKAPLARALALVAAARTELEKGRHIAGELRPSR
jgi:hypothetical protein